MIEAEIVLGRKLRSSEVIFCEMQKDRTGYRFGKDKNGNLMIFKDGRNKKHKA